jgi:nicotinamidase-related amidase
MDALLIIDMQEAYFKDKLQFDVDGVIMRINRIAESVRHDQGFGIRRLSYANGPSSFESATGYRAPQLAVAQFDNGKGNH